LGPSPRGRTRTMPSSAAKGLPLRRCRLAPPSVPAAAAGLPSCCACAQTCTLPISAVMCPPAFVRPSTQTVPTTPSFWPTRGWPVSAERTPSASSCRLMPCCRRRGQGALGVQCRDDVASLTTLAPIDHAPTRAAVTAERAFLSGLGGGCALPIARLRHCGRGLPGPARPRFSPGRFVPRRRAGAGQVGRGAGSGPRTRSGGAGERRRRHFGRETVSRPSPHGAFPGSPQVKGPGLRGRVVVNTRAPHQAEKLSTLLARYGARTLLYRALTLPRRPTPHSWTGPVRGGCRRRL
jgi:hypothetical protein